MVDMKGGMFTSLSGNWGTPQALFDELDKEFDFTLDPCANRDRLLKENICFRCEDDDYPTGLESDWDGHTVFMNPPYGREISKWLKKAHEESSKGITIVCLIPSRTDTRWWHDYVMKADEIRFVKGRLKFGDQKNSAPFPSAIIIFNSKSIN